ncbi:MAG TPA: 4-hydroxy-tetrahydrodipicolinate reductase [Thiotrichaceae bacterium]|jgi:4-hydroxy-tetrahydrodipicolinate reductase|nr:4-hydroxy-tetrahydrodipicolinate reductase [Thiotrichaceae bacterium]HIM08419.1 4-hydroxy-tetrahydrodipicolinate reductase [Gammaproteobacteria bacterium]
MVRVGVCGAAGRMGKTILEVCNDNDDIEIAAAIEYSGSPMLGLDAGDVAGIGNLGVTITDNITSVADQVDVIIDFTLATSLSANIRKCISSEIKMVIGTTGLTQDDHGLIDFASNNISIVFAPNMSIGVNLCFKLLEMAAKVIGEDTDIEIIEAHHRHKKDAPSGTALHMGEVVAHTLGRNLKEVAVYGREGITGERDRKTIGFETIRAGDIVGDHTVMFVADGERVEITHKASSRKTFANGAVRAAQWLSDKDKGLFDMQDVLNLK